MQLSNPRPARKMQEKEQVLSWDIVQHLYSSLHTQSLLTHALAYHTWILCAQRTHVDAEQGKGAWAGPGRASRTSGTVQQPNFCQLFYQLGSSPRGRSHENPESALSEPQLFMWFQLARAIQDFKGLVAKDGPTCLCLHPSQLASGLLPES